MKPSKQHSGMLSQVISLFGLPMLCFVSPDPENAVAVSARTDADVVAEELDELVFVRYCKTNRLNGELLSQIGNLKIDSCFQQRIPTDVKIALAFAISSSVGRRIGRVVLRLSASYLEAA